MQPSALYKTPGQQLDDNRNDALMSSSMETVVPTTWRTPDIVSDLRGTHNSVGQSGWRVDTTSSDATRSTPYDQLAGAGWADGQSQLYQFLTKITFTLLYLSS